MLSCKIANIGQKPASDSSKSQSQTQKGSNECLFNTDTHYANFRDLKKIQSLTVSQGWKPVSDTVGKLMSLDTVYFFFFLHTEVIQVNTPRAFSTCAVHPFPPNPICWSQRVSVFCLRLKVLVPYTEHYCGGEIVGISR